MWTNISGVVGAAIQKVQKIQNEIECQMDEAVGRDRSIGADNNHASLSASSTMASLLPPDNGSSESLARNGSVGSSIASATSLGAIAESEDAVHSTVDMDDSTGAKPDLPNDASSSASSSQPARKTPVRRAKGKPKLSPVAVATDSAASEQVTEPCLAPSPSLVESHQKELELLRAECKEKVGAVEIKFQKEVDRLLRELDLLREENEKQREEATRQREELNRGHSEELSRLKNQISELRKQQGLERAEAESRLAAVRAECEDRVQQCLASTKQKAGEHSSDSSLLQAELDDYKFRVSKLEQQLLDESRRMTNDVNKLQGELAQESQAYQREKEDHQRVRDEYQRAKDDLQRLSEENRTLTARLEQHIHNEAQIVADMAKLKEALVDRERALETANVKLAESVRLAEETQGRISDLQAELHEKSAAWRSSQQAAVDDVDAKKQIARLLEELAEKNTKLQAFETEGAQLAKKQAELEKVIRKNRSELKEKDAEIAKLKESRDQLVKAIEQTQDVLKKTENDNNTNNKHMLAMQAVSREATDKINKLEAELQGKQEEVVSQRKALEATWNDINELKKLIIELKAERDDLKKQLGEGTSRVLETENTRRDVEQREAVLRATSKQLEETLKQQMMESSLREERLRTEIQNMQKKWQEAILSREQLANELTQVTTPLLRQIASLQDQLRIKSDMFIGIESNLNERILKAENQYEQAEHRRGLLEEQVVHLKSQLASVTAAHKECQEKLLTCEALVERAKKMESVFQEDKRSLESKLAYELAQNKSMTVALKELELKYKMDLQEAHEQQSLQSSQHSLEMSKLRHDLSHMGEQLKMERYNSKLQRASAHTGQPSPLAGAQRMPLYAGGSKTPRGQGGPAENGLEEDDDDGAKDGTLPANLPNGELSFVATEKLIQRQRQRDEELASLQMQISKLEMSRAALLEEVSYLSAQNAQLDEQLHQVGSLRSDLSAMMKQRDVLLALLGEKEEELEAAMHDMAEVKNMYQTHIQDLLEKLTPSST